MGIRSRATLRPRWVALVIAVVYAALLVIGLTAARGSLAGPNPDNVFAGLGFGAILHLLYGGVAVLGLLAVTKPAGAHAYCWFVFFVFSGLTAYGLLAALSDSGDRLNIEWTNVALYAITALGALAAGLVSLSSGRRETGGRPRGRQGHYEEAA